MKIIIDEEKFNSDNVFYCNTIKFKDDDSIPVRLNIPKEFIEHYNSNKFKESLKRIKLDMMHSYIYYRGVSGKYEIELLDMLIDAFNNSEVIE